MLSTLKTRPRSVFFGFLYMVAMGACGLDHTGLCTDQGEPCVSSLSCAEMGTCPIECMMGLLRCGNVCVEPMSDANFCGASGDCRGANAGMACTDGRVCSSGVCGAACPEGQIQCGLSCVDTATNPLHCGGCDKGCPANVQGGAYACEAAQCVFQCFPGLRDSNQSLVDGCEDHSELILWLDATYIVGLKDGDDISIWHDRSGWDRDATQSNAAKKPKYRTKVVGSMPALHFNAQQGHFLEVPLLQLFGTKSAELSVGVVFKADTPNLRGFLLTQSQPDCASEFGLGYHVSNQPRANFGLKGECTGASVMQEDIDAEWNRALITVQGTGSAPANVHIIRNGVEQTVVSEDMGWTGAGFYGTGTSRLIVGAHDNNGSIKAHHNGFIAEILVVARALDAKEKEFLNKYWINRYGNF